MKDVLRSCRVSLQPKNLHTLTDTRLLEKLERIGSAPYVDPRSNKDDDKSDRIVIYCSEKRFEQHPNDPNKVWDEANRHTYYFRLGESPCTNNPGLPLSLRTAAYTKSSGQESGLNSAITICPWYLERLGIPTPVEPLRQGDGYPSPERSINPKNYRDTLALNANIKPIDLRKSLVTTFLHEVSHQLQT